VECPGEVVYFCVGYIQAMWENTGIQSNAMQCKPSVRVPCSNNPLLTILFPCLCPPPVCVVGPERLEGLIAPDALGIVALIVPNPQMEYPPLSSHPHAEVVAA